MKNICIFLFLYVALLACTSDRQAFEGAELLTWNDFKEQKELHGRVLDFGDEVLKPFSIQVYDSVLVSLEFENEKFFQLFNLNTMQKIGDRINKGGGPNDAAMPMIIYNNQKTAQFIDIAKGNVLTYNLEEFVHDEYVKPTSKLQLNTESASKVALLSNGYLSFSPSENNQLTLFNTKGQKVKEMAPYPNCLAEDYPSQEKHDIYVMGLISNNKDRFALCYYMNNLIEIYDKDGKRVKALFGPEQTLYKLGSEKVQNIDTYFRPVPVGDSFMVLFNGTRPREKGYSSSCTKLLSFSWEGTPECVYTLDDPIFAFCVDAPNRKVYGISENPEFHIVEYSY